MANNKDPNLKQPGEKEPGKYHYNPGNMSGKPWIAANQSLNSERMLTGYAAVISMIKAAMIDEAIGRGSS